MTTKEYFHAHYVRIGQLVGAALKGPQDKFLKERVEIWERFRGDPEKYRRFLKRFNRMRQAKENRP